MWESAQALEAFQKSAACALLVKDLGYEDAVRSPSSAMPCLSWNQGFDLSIELYGRMTLTILSGTADLEEWQNAFRDAFSGFLPKDCEELQGSPPFSWFAVTFADKIPEQQQLQLTKNKVKNALDVCYLFFRWNGHGASSEREKIAFRDPESREAWAKALAKATPPVQSWILERWDIGEAA